MGQRKYLKESIKLGDETLSVETGKVAKQADGSVIISYGETMLLVTAVSAHTAKEGLDFFPLTVEYRESTYAAGRIPGNYFRREGRPNEKETLTCRLIDRPVRPLFPDGYRFETQIVGSVISSDSENDPDVIAITGASCALYLSDIPFDNPIAAVRVGLIDGKYIINPTYDERRDSQLNLVVAGTEEAIVMVEAEAREVAENIMVEAMMLAHKEIKRLCLWQRELFKALDIKKREFEASPLDEDLTAEIEKNYTDRLREALDTTGKDKITSYATIDALKKEVVASYPEDDPTKRAMAGKVFGHLKEKIFRDDMLGNRRRPDGRKFSEIRPISCEVGWLPRVHGSSLFHARRNAGDCHGNFGNENGRAVHRRFGKGRSQKTLFAALQFPAVFGRRNRTSRLHQPPRSRTRQSRAPGARSCFARRRRISIHASHRFRHYRIKWL
jgi:polyribonucleotide nucleotidyltransferase